METTFSKQNVISINGTALYLRVGNGSLMRAKREMSNVFETDCTDRKDFTVFQYSVTNNFVPINDRIRFQGNVVKVNHI
jgi:hypothetical protein